MQPSLEADRPEQRVVRVEPVFGSYSFPEHISSGEQTAGSKVSIDGFGEAQKPIREVTIEKDLQSCEDGFPLFHEVVQEVLVHQIFGSLTPILDQDNAVILSGLEVVLQAVPQIGSGYPFDVHTCCGHVPRLLSDVRFVVSSVQLNC